MIMLNDLARTRLLAAAYIAAAVTTVALAGQARLQVPGLTRETWTVDGVERTALVATPRTSAPHQPLVLVFHGHGGTSANAARTFRIHELWPEAVVIYPQGLPTA